MPSFSTKSEAKLLTCDHRLQRLFREVVQAVDCAVLWGYRGPEDQAKFKAEGKSNAAWGQSKHNVVPSKAVDVVPYPVPDWEDHAQFRAFAAIVMEQAARLGIKIRYGGDWDGDGVQDKNDWDLVHFELID